MGLVFTSRGGIVRWVGGRIPYLPVVDPNVGVSIPTYTQFVNAVGEWNSLQSAVQFVPAMPNDTRVLYVRGVKACQCTVGMHVGPLSRPNTPSIKKGGGVLSCVHGGGRLVHELGHAIGLKHEGQRWDTLLYAECIDPFNELAEDITLMPVGEFDCNSMMGKGCRHYDPNPKLCSQVTDNDQLPTEGDLNAVAELYASPVVGVGVAQNSVSAVIRSSVGKARIAVRHGLFGWSRETIAPFVITSPPAAVAAGSTLHVFARRTNMGIWHRTWPHGKWDDLGGFASSPPVAISRPDGRVDLFVRNEKGNVLHKFFDGFSWFPGQTSWNEIPGKIIGPPAVILRSSGQLELFARRPDGTIGTTRMAGGGWLGGVGFGGPPSPLSANPVQPELLAQPAPKLKKLEKPKLHPITWLGIGGNGRGRPVIVSPFKDRVDCFIRGRDGRMYHRWRVGDRWFPDRAEPWERIGLGVISGPPAVVTAKPGRIDCFATGRNGFLMHKWLTLSDGGKWHPSRKGPWKKLEGTLTGAPTVVSSHKNYAWVLATLVDGHLHASLYHLLDGNDGGEWTGFTPVDESVG
ncbi:hypothetical protein JYT22_00130 [Endomicrobium sp. AH-315-J14]|nr:hypothetical protein [Endomicrobium sp. AH-315-J14]